MALILNVYQGSEHRFFLLSFTFNNTLLNISNIKNFKLKLRILVTLNYTSLSGCSKNNICFR